MNTILTALARWFYYYGEMAAGAPSDRGSYEAPVPAQLRGKDKE